LSAVKNIVAYPSLSWAKGNVVDIQITHEHASKLYGVQKLIKILGLEKDEVLAIGDGHNDFPLFEAAGFKVAMGNAPEELKAIADYIAPSLKDDGVAETIHRFIH